MGPRLHSAVGRPRSGGPTPLTPFPPLGSSQLLGAAPSVNRSWWRSVTGSSPPHRGCGSAGRGMPSHPLLRRTVSPYHVCLIRPSQGNLPQRPPAAQRTESGTWPAPHMGHPSTMKGSSHQERKTQPSHATRQPKLCLSSLSFFSMISKVIQSQKYISSSQKNNKKPENSLED